MNRFAMLACGMAVSTTLLAANSADAATFTDMTFNNVDYITQNYTLGAGTTVTSSGQTSTDGNPQPAYEADAHIVVGGSILATALNSNFVYNPGSSGAIGSIDASLDRYATAGQSSGVANYTLRILAAQGGNLYEDIATFIPLGDGGSVWHTLSQTGLTANDFGLFSSTNLAGADFTTHPDFSGGPITFGFAMYRGGTSIDYDTTALADNFSLEISAVPEPSTWAMMILGFAGVGFMAYRRKAKPLLMAV